MRINLKIKIKGSETWQSIKIIIYKNNKCCEKYNLLQGKRSNLYVG